MARPLRLVSPGAMVQVTCRGHARPRLDADDADCETFLAVPDAVVRRYHELGYAWCVMANHDHLMIETPEGNLSASMQQFNEV